MEVDHITTPQPQFAIADLYAGVISSTYGLETKEELRACMAPSDELVEVWDAAINMLNLGRTQDYHDLAGQALEMSLPLLAYCQYTPKLVTVGRQMDHWWGDFWQGDEERGLALVE